MGKRKKKKGKVPGQTGVYASHPGKGKSPRNGGEEKAKGVRVERGREKKSVFGQRVFVSPFLLKKKGKVPGHSHEKRSQPRPMRKRGNGTKREGFYTGGGISKRAHPEGGGVPRQRGKKSGIHKN